MALNDDINANYVERFNRTLKTMIFRYLAKNKTDRDIDVLQKLVESYNKTPHRFMGNIAQKDVSNQNEVVLFAYMYLKSNTKDNIKVNLDKQKLRKRRLHKYKLGQLVRISHQRRPFTRPHNEQWTYEVFKINRRFQMQSIPLYQLVDMLESPILGVFYQNELQAVNKTEDTLLYCVTTDDIYKDMQTDKHLFDFSNYDKSHFLYDSTNPKKPGLFKDWWHSYI